MKLSPQALGGKSACRQLLAELGDAQCPYPRERERPVLGSALARNAVAVLLAGLSFVRLLPRRSIATANLTRQHLRWRMGDHQVVDHLLVTPPAEHLLVHGLVGQRVRHGIGLAAHVLELVAAREAGLEHLGDLAVEVRQRRTVHLVKASQLLDHQLAVALDAEVAHGEALREGGGHAHGEKRAPILGHIIGHGTREVLRLLLNGTA
mmetsp:Transcript_22537/g.60974  ORF Transcript_22537/g.60974 Transcript_22537/m.60974 type:complete len:207 (-) Transcript_22537:276-896(-)